MRPDTSRIPACRGAPTRKDGDRVASFQFRVGLGLGHPGLGKSLGICARQVAPSETPFSDTMRAHCPPTQHPAQQRGSHRSFPNPRSGRPPCLRRSLCLIHFPASLVTAALSFVRALATNWLPQPKTRRQKGKGMRTFWCLAYLDADQSRLFIPAKARIAKVRRSKPTSDRHAVGE